MTNLTKNNKPHSLEDCILPPAALRKVGKKGIYYGEQHYMNTELQAHIGQEVMLFKVGADTLLVCIGSELICAITCVPNRQFTSGELVTTKQSCQRGMVLYCDYVNQFYLVQVEGERYFRQMHTNELQANEGVLS